MPDVDGFMHPVQCDSRPYLRCDALDMTAMARRGLERSHQGNMNCTGLGGFCSLNSPAFNILRLRVVGETNGWTMRMVYIC